MRKIHAKANKIVSFITVALLYEIQKTMSTVFLVKKQKIFNCGRKENYRQFEKYG